LSSAPYAANYAYRSEQFQLGERMKKVFSKVKEELFALLPPTIFFFVALHIVALIRALMTKAAGISPLSTVSIAVAALILGKAVLIADLLPFINRYPKEPLIYNVAWKTAIYLIISGVIHYLERLFEYSRGAGGVVAGNHRLLTEIVWPHFWAIQIVLFVLILTYCTARELGRVIGEQRALRIFFGPLPLPVL
jgi:hypothetical protein